MFCVIIKYFIEQFFCLTYKKEFENLRTKKDRGLLDQISLDGKSLFSVDQKFHFH